MYLLHYLFIKIGQIDFKQKITDKAHSWEQHYSYGCKFNCHVIPHLYIFVLKLNK